MTFESRLKGKIILVVDDEPDITESVSEGLICASFIGRVTTVLPYNTC
jgi:hypothetical protein